MTTIDRILTTIDRALVPAENDLIARARQLAATRADRLAHAQFTSLVTGTDWDGTPIADPTAPNLCENQ